MCVPRLHVVDNEGEGRSKSDNDACLTSLAANPDLLFAVADFSSSVAEINQNQHRHHHYRKGPQRRRSSSLSIMPTSSAIHRHRKTKFKISRHFLLQQLEPARAVSSAVFEQPAR